MSLKDVPFLFSFVISTALSVECRSVLFPPVFQQKRYQTLFKQCLISFKLYQTSFLQDAE